ncbi:4Fe-4S binding protein [Enorma phocaeensis]
MGCGACADACPQHCIEEGGPFYIRQEHCLHCGLCSEVCPVQAIDRKEVA